MTYGKTRDMIEVRKTLAHYYYDLIAASPDLVLKKYREATRPADIIFYGYLYQEKKCFGLDHNDLIVLAHTSSTPTKCGSNSERLEYVMIDNSGHRPPASTGSWRCFAPYHGNLFVVGDPDRAIYTPAW